MATGDTSIHKLIDAADALHEVKAALTLLMALEARSGEPEANGAHVVLMDASGRVASAIELIGGVTADLKTEGGQ